MEKAHGPETGIQVQLFAEIQLGSNFASVWPTDVGEAHRSQKYGVGRSASVESRGGKRIATAQILRRTCRILGHLKRYGGHGSRQHFEHANRFRDDLDADAVTRQERNFKHSLVHVSHFLIARES